MQYSKLIIAISTVVGLTSVQAQTFTQIQNLDYGSARVVSITPNYTTVYQQQCRSVPVERRNQGGGVVGAIVGAAIGNQIGGGSGRDIATAAGAVIGGQLGSQNDGISVEMQTRCSQQPVQVQSGEIVTFEYRGRRFTQIFN